MLPQDAEARIIYHGCFNHNAVILEGDYESTGYGVAMPETSSALLTVCNASLLHSSFMQISELFMSMLCPWTCVQLSA